MNATSAAFCFFVLPFPLWEFMFVSPVVSGLSVAFHSVDAFVATLVVALLLWHSCDQSYSVLPRALFFACASQIQCRVPLL
jgi:hypothetical protein